MCRVLFARAPVLGRCFFVSVNAAGIDLQGGSSEWFQGHPQMYDLPQAEGVLPRAFNDRSRVRDYNDAWRA